MAKTSAQDERIHPGREQGAALLIIVAILAIIAAMAVGMSYYGSPTQHLDQSRQSATDLERIKTAISSFVIGNSRLPCPANAANTSWTEDCATPSANAVVPWKTLGLQESDSVDQWGHRIAYYPSSALTSGTPFAAAIPSDGLSVYSDYDVSGNPIGSAQSAAYVLVSAGENGAGGWMMSGLRKTVPVPPTAEADNADGDASFIKAGHDTGTTYFDDLLVFDTASNICAENSICTSAPQAEAFFNSTDNPTSFVSTNSNYGKLVRASNGKTAAAGQDNVIHFSEDPEVKDGKAMDSVPEHKAVCVWLNQKLTFQTQSIRAYFTFNWWPGEESNTQHGFADGFTMTVVSWGTATSSCGYDGSSLGYKDMSLQNVKRMAVEFDTYQYSGTDGSYDQTTNDPDRNHVSVLFNNSINHNGTPGSAGGWAGSCSANSTNGSAGGCTYKTSGTNWRAWLEEKSRVEFPHIQPYNVRIELQRGCDATCTTCGAGGGYVQTRAWIDCTHGSCSTLTGTSPRATLDAATTRTINYCTPQPSNWGSEMNDVMLGFTFATGGATSALSIREINMGNASVQ